MTADADDRAPEPIPADDPDDAGPDATAADEAAQAAGAQSELDLGVLSTGSVPVDRALAPLDGLAERPVSGHAEVFEQVLDELANTMTEPTAELDARRPDEPGVPPASH
jgi:hypothetical protein